MESFRRLHAAAIAGMAISALTGVSSMLLFITVRWPGESGRYVKVIFVASIVTFVSSASMAVLAAARDTHASDVQNRRSPPNH